MSLSVEFLVFQYLKSNCDPKIVEKFCQKVKLDPTSKNSGENIPELSEILKQFHEDKNVEKSTNTKKRKIGMNYIDRSETICSKKGVYMLIRKIIMKNFKYYQIVNGHKSLCSRHVFCLTYLVNSNFWS